MSVALYRMYDAEGALLYVGQTANIGRRLAAHATEKSWWSEVARIDLAHFANRDSATAAESHAIEAEAPRHNLYDARKPNGDDCGSDEERAEWGARIRSARRRQGLTQDALASLVAYGSGCPLNRSAVAHWEAGTNAPALRYRDTLAEVLNTRTDDLFGTAA